MILKTFIFDYEVTNNNDSPAQGVFGVGRRIPMTIKAGEKFV
jgi:hypothetical protein